MFIRKVNGREYKTESGMPIKERLEKVLSDILSDKYDAKIKITLEDCEDVLIGEVEDDDSEKKTNS